MMEYDEAVNQRISKLASSACAELFAAYGLELQPSDRSWADSDERLLCGVVGFVGRKLRGSCLVAGGEQPLGASCPSGNQLRDWVGELANQLAGRMKTKLLAHNVEVSLTTPIVISGVRLEPLPRSNVEPAVFISDAGAVLVWAEVETREDFVLGSEHPSASTGEGDVLLF